MLINFDLERWVESASEKKRFAVLFFPALLSRLLLNIFFHVKYGWRAANHVELWLYTGVARGTHISALEGRYLDPTYWFLRPLGLLLPEGLHMYAVEFTGLVLTCLAGYLMYVFFRNLFGHLKAFVAAAIYLFLVESIALNVVGFTHATVQVPVTFLLLIIAVKGLNAGSPSSRLKHSLLYLVVFFFGLMINKEIGVAVIITLGLCAVKLAPERHRKNAFLLACLSILLFSHFILVEMVKAVISDLPQGQSGSADLVPVTKSVFWVRYNILWLLLPLGLFHIYRGRDVATFSFITIGFLTALQMDRGTRIMAVGMAMMAAHALTGFQKRLIKINSGEDFKSVDASFGSVLVMAVILLPLSFKLQVTRLSYQIVFLTAGILITALLKKSLNASPRKTLTLILLVICMPSLIVNAIFINEIEPRRISYQLEYEFLEYLKDRPDGQILIEWDHGYLAEVVSGKKSVSTPALIEREKHHLLWLTQPQSANYLNLRKIRYILITSKNLNVVRRADDRYYWAISGGLLFKPDKIPRVENANFVTAFKLRHARHNESMFRLLKSGIDEATGIKTYLYEVIPIEKTLYEASIGGVFRNIGGDKKADVSVLFEELNGSVGDYVRREEFSPGFTQRIYWVPRQDMRRCGIDSEPVEGVWGYSGKALFWNTGDDINFTLKIYMYDKGSLDSLQARNESLMYSQNLYLEAYQKVSVNYTLKKKDPFAEYLLDFDAPSQVKYLEGESDNPVYDALEVVHISCWPDSEFDSKEGYDAEEERGGNALYDLFTRVYMWLRRALGI